MLELSHVTKRFGARTVVDDLCLAVPDHCIFGFVGENGAGKTTTMKMILGLLRADAGEIRVDGELVSFGNSRTNRLVGYLPDVPEFYGFLTAREYLLLCGEVSGIPKREREPRAEELLALVGLAGVKQRIQGFSRGMKQRLGIAQALLGNPKLLVCDEPTSALDPAGRREILGLLQSLVGRATVLFSTHILSDVERICDVCAVLHAGRLVAQGSMQELKGAGGKEGFLVEFLRAEDAGKFAELMPGGERVDAVTLTYGAVVEGGVSSGAGEGAVPGRVALSGAGGNHLPPEASISAHKGVKMSGWTREKNPETMERYALGSENDRMAAAMALLVREGIAVRRIEQRERTLEDMFFGLMDGGKL